MLHVEKDKIAVQDPDSNRTGTWNCDSEDSQDMQLLALGHDSALNNLMKRHAEKLFNYLLRCLQNEEDASDLAQETFVRVYQNCSKFDPKRRFSTWLYSIATNLVKDRFRHRARHPEVSLDRKTERDLSIEDCFVTPGPTPSESLLGAEQGELVRLAIQELPEDLRLPLLLYEFEGLRHADIGKILKCSGKAVETKLYRARQILRIQLKALLK